MRFRNRDTYTTCVTGWATAQSSAVTCTTVTTQVVSGAVRSGTDVSDVFRWTSAVVTGDQVCAIAAIYTRL